MRIAALILLTAALALPAQGQPAPQPATAPAPGDDIIGSLLDPHHKPSALEEEEPDTAGQRQTRSGPDVVMTPQGGRGGAVVTYAPAPRSQRDQPVRIEETGKTPDRPPGERDLAYEQRIRASFAAAEGFQGPLDGGWTLAAGADDLFALQLVDKPDRLEGVWRDLRRKGALSASGLVDEIQRQGQDLTLRFMARPGGKPTVATLHAEADGRWRGALEDAGQRKTVVLRRSGL
jgi:hypothetical protein